MTRKKAAQSQPDSRLGSPKDESYGNLMKQIDDCILPLTNAYIRSLRLPPSQQFQFRKGTSVAKVRSVLRTWRPQMYSVNETKQNFDVPQVIGSLLDRYITSSEFKQSDRLEAKAAKKFIETNFDGNAIDEYVLKHPVLQPLIERMQNIVGGLFQHRLDLSSLYKETGHGPNSTTTISLKDAFIHIKDRDFSGTEASLQQFHHYLRWDNPLREMLVEFSDELRAMINGENVPLGFVVGCTDTSFVPKKFDSLRTMCPEPTVVAFFAQMIAKEITRILKSIGIDLKTQPNVHRMLAKLASLYPELNLGTIDWSEASDRIWTMLVMVCFEKADPSWYNFMKNVCRVGRTKVTFTVYFDETGEFSSLEELNTFLSEKTDEFEVIVSNTGLIATVDAWFETTMFCTMGNPLTFPLQTLLFFAFLTACHELAENRLNSDESECIDLNFPSSFGDDGIIDTRAFPEIEFYAPLLGWKLNRDKSFVSGDFRESCGGDYYHGRYCRPFSPKRPPLSNKYSYKRNLLVLQAWSYIVVNNLSYVVTEIGGDTQPLESWLLDFHEEYKLGKVCVVPPSYPDGSGLRMENWLSGMQVDRDLFYDYSRIPALKYGGFDNPDPWFSFPGKGRYHWPTYNWGDRNYSFKCVQSRPSKRLLEEPSIDSAHYYLRGLKSRSGDLGWTQDSAMYGGKPDFFNIDVKGQVVLSSDDYSLKNKECRLYKTTTTTTIWE